VTSERSKANWSTTAARSEKPAGLASWILREEIMRNGALRSGDCLSEASLSHFSGMQYNFSKIRAALTFLFLFRQGKRKDKTLLYFRTNHYICKISVCYHIIIVV
jgi:hypothetical protein